MAVENRAVVLEFAFSISAAACSNRLLPKGESVSELVEEVVSELAIKGSPLWLLLELAITTEESV